MRPIRSLLFAPANRSELIEKFPRYHADAFAIDLEDGTPESDKASARRDLPRTVAFLRDRALKGQLLVRTNDGRSPYLEADLVAALATPIDGIMMPKLGNLADLRRIDAALSDAEARTGRALALIGLIETAVGIMNVERLATSGDSHLSGLAFGAEDFITDVDGRRTAEGLEVLYARSRVVIAAKAAGLAALDQVFVNIRHDEAFQRDAELGRQLGYGGKMCIVPRQVVMANEIFSPSLEEVERSRRLIHTYEAARAEGHGTIDFDGGMVDEPVLRRAQAIVQLAVDLEMERPKNRSRESEAAGDVPFERRRT
jgi:citrate lyase subunit beta/citryl-CoA lyase